MEPGYYYARWLEDGEKAPLIIIKIVNDFDAYNRQVIYTFGDDNDYRITEFKDIKGPLNPSTMLSPSHPK